MNQKKFWERFHKILSSDQRLDDPDAMADLEDPGGKKRTLLALERTFTPRDVPFWLTSVPFWPGSGLPLPSWDLVF